MALFAEKRKTERTTGEFPITVRALATRDGWTDHIRDGGAVILDISAGGVQMCSDAVHEVGQTVRLVVPGTADEPEAAVEATVVWKRRNDIARFGRWACGLEFTPAIQPGIPTLRSRHWAHNRPHGSAPKPPVSP